MCKKICQVFIGILFILTIAITSFASNNEYMFPQSNNKLLTDEDIAGYSKAELRIGLNEIYARRGRKFKAEDLKTYFSDKSWYSPKYEADKFDEKVFNTFEKNNIEFLTKARDSLKKDTDKIPGTKTSNNQGTTTSLDKTTTLDKDSSKETTTDYGFTYDHGPFKLTTDLLHGGKSINVQSFEIISLESHGSSHYWATYTTEGTTTYKGQCYFQANCYDKDGYIIGTPVIYITPEKDGSFKIKDKTTIEKDTVKIEFTLE